MGVDECESTPPYWNGGCAACCGERLLGGMSLNGHVRHNMSGGIILDPEVSGSRILFRYHGLKPSGVFH